MVRRREYEQRAEHANEVRGHHEPDHDPGDAAGDRDGASLGADDQTDGSGLQALRSKGDVFSARWSSRPKTKIAIVTVPIASA